MFKVYFSKLEAKIRLIFNMYDCNKDGKVTQEDVRILLSYVPINKVNTSVHLANIAGLYNKGFLDRLPDFQDRIKIQKELVTYLS